MLNYIRQAYGGIHINIWILATAMFINRCGSMVLLFMSVYLTKNLHFSIPEAGIVLSMFGFGSLCGAFIGGKLVDKIGFYPILIWSLLLSGCCIIILGQVQNYWLVAIFTFMMNATGDSFRPANSASISYYSSKKDYTRSIALMRLAMNLGFTIGPVLGGILAAISYKFLFWADGLTCMFASAFIFIILPGKMDKNKKVQAKTPETSTNETEFLPESISPYKDKHYLIFLVCTTIYATAFFQFFTSLPLFFKTVYELKEKQIGLLMACNGIGVAVIEMFLINYIQHKWTKFNFISLGAFLLAVSFFVLIPYHHIVVLFLCMVFLTFSEMFAMPFMSTYAINKSTKAFIGQYTALYSMSWSVAQITSPIIGTNVIARGGFTILWLVLIGLALISLLGFQWLQRHNQTEQNHHD